MCEAPPVVAPCDAPPPVAACEAPAGLRVGPPEGAFGAGAAGFFESVAAPTRLAALSSPARINAAEPFFMALRRSCMVIVSSFLFRARAHLGGANTLLNVADFPIREGYFHVFVVEDFFCAQLRHPGRLTESSDYLLLGLAR